MPFKNLSNTESTKQGMQSLRERIATARSLVVAGAGLTGVELASELGQEYGPSASKDVTFIAADVLPLGPEARAYTH